MKRILQMRIDKTRVYVSTVADDARETALRHGLGLEVAEFCTAMNMDDDFPMWDERVRAKLEAIERRTFHAPFNELCPSAIEPRVVEITRERYIQAAALAVGYGAQRMVVHSGYVPLVYFKEYFIERSVEFWSALLAELPQSLSLMLENVLEDAPELDSEIVRRVNDPRLRLCFDIGHANTIVSEVPMEHWINVNAPYIGHVHVHNNYRTWDDHNPPGDGIIDMRRAMTQLTELVGEDTTFAIESISAMPAADWLTEEGFI